MGADQPWFVVVHFHCHSEVQCIIKEILCVGGWVVAKRRVWEKLINVYNTTNIHIFSKSESANSSSIVCI